MIRANEQATLRPSTDAKRSRQRRPFYTAPFRWLNRVWAFFGKEVAELRRQPLLILSLIGGPLLVLVAFGASYRNSNPVLRTAIVVPAGGVSGVSTEQIRSLAGANFQIDLITEDRAAAEEQLRRGNLDVIQILPADPAQTVQNGQNSEIEFRSNAINPLEEGWIRYLAYAEVNEINKALLRDQATQAQQSATGIKARVTTARERLAAIEASAGQGDIEQSREDLRQLVQAVGELEAILPPGGTLAGGQIDVTELRSDLARVRTSAETVDRNLEAGTVNQQLGEISQMRADLEELERTIDLFTGTPSDLLVAPLRERYTNVRGGAYEAVVYYAPAVLALLLQHTAITLGALALVRERLLGAFEIFRVAPVGAIQVLLGKYLGYTVFVAITAGALFAAMLALGVPLLGNPYLFAALMLLLTLASLGVGFLISSVAKSDSQAIQMAMITLLLSIFFSGFFIALESFVPAALTLSYIIPMTHGVTGLRDLMLRGTPPHPGAWIALGLIAGISFVAVTLMTHRQMRRA
jgi:ABC-2 type transport system permease protein